MMSGKKPLERRCKEKSGEAFKKRTNGRGDSRGELQQ